MRPARFCLQTGILFLFLLSPASAVTNSVGKPLPPDAAPPAQQVFRYIHGSEPSSYDISVALYEAQGAVSLFERLTMLNENLEIVPGAAARWEMSPDGRRWTFHLRPGARWSDGRPVTAHDFEYSYKRFLDPAVGSVYAFFYYEIKGAKAYNQGKVKDSSTVGVKAINDLTLVIETERPCPYLPFIVAFAGSSPVPRWQVEKYGKKWSDAGTFVSNSSYVLTEWRKGQRAVLSLNKYYNGPYKGYLEKIIQLFTAGSPGAVGTLPYENNEVDWQTVAVTDLARVEKDPVLKTQLVRYAFPDSWFLIFQTRKPPFNSLKVRQAISHAIDREALCQTALRGISIPAYSMLPPNFPGSTSAQLKSVQAYNPALAKKLLAEAGYPNGAGFPKLDLWVGNASPAQNILTQAIQTMLKTTLGITLTIKASEDKVYRDNLYKMEIPIGLGGFNADYPDPNNLLAMVWHSQPIGYGRQDWKNPTFDRLVDAAAFEMNPVKRMTLYADAERTLVEDVGGVFLVHSLTIELRKPWLKGLKMNKYGYLFFTWIGTVHTQMYIGKR